MAWCDLARCGDEGNDDGDNENMEQNAPSDAPVEAALPGAAQLAEIVLNRRGSLEDPSESIVFTPVAVAVRHRGGSPQDQSADQGDVSLAA